MAAPDGPGVQVQTSRLALELVKLGMGWTVVDFFTAARLDPAQFVTLELHELPPMSLYSYHARAHPPGLHATRMLAMLPGLLHEALSPRPRK
jgi:DNA-binding transcriptional LysR family regulator